MQKARNFYATKLQSSTIFENPPPWEARSEMINFASCSPSLVSRSHLARLRRRQEKRVWLRETSPSPILTISSKWSSNVPHSSILSLQIWVLDMGVAIRHSRLYASLHICYTLQVSTTSWCRQALCTGTATQ